MNPLGSYDFDGFSRATQELEIAGLKACAEGSLDVLIEAWLNGLTSGARNPLIGDYGSGTGERTAEIAREFPRARVIGFEPSRALLEFSSSAHRAANLSFLSLTPGVFPEEFRLRFDAMLCRLVLQHVSAPLETLKCMREMLGFGGALLTSDVDVRDFYLEPLCSDWTSVWQKVLEARRALGGDPEIGRRLPALLQQAGYRAVKVLRRERLVEPIATLLDSRLAERWLSILPAEEAARGLDVLRRHIATQKDLGGLVLGPTWYDVSALR